MSISNYFITKEEAKIHIEAASTVDQRRDPNYTWGVLFPIDVLEEFIKNAKANSQVKNLRIYFAKSYNAATGKMEKDVVIIGTDKDKVDVPFLDIDMEIKTLADNGDNIVGKGLPCPNICQQ